MKIGGIDEAGRGPAIGPMVIVGAEADERILEGYRGVIKKDSKGYSSTRREYLYRDLIRSEISFYPVIIYPFTIDMWMRHLGGLNDMEAYFMSRIIDRMESSRIFIDSCDNQPRKFLSRLDKYLRREVDVIAEINADIKYTIVSIASIFAKVIRDREVHRLGMEFGFSLSGYPSDPRTISFISSWIDLHRYPPPFSRWEWKTIKRLLKGKALNHY